MKQTWTRNDLIHFNAQHAVLVAVDSDGCVFDSMTVKQRIFHSGIIQFWNLVHIEHEFRQVAEWTALYSPWRGLNRFELLLRIFQALKKYFPESGNQVDIRALQAFVQSGVPLSADELAARVLRTNDPELQKTLAWSRSVSRKIASLPEMPVFSEVAAGLKKIRAAADTIVVSQTAEEALVREWHHAGLDSLVDVIAGAELGSKKESLATAMDGRYAKDRVLMVGDAPGDLEAANAVGSFFFPIIPGAEDASWIELCETGLDRVLDGTFTGDYQTELIARFQSALSEIPPWVNPV